jgi:hypothetical protein
MSLRFIIRYSGNEMKKLATPPILLIVVLLCLVSAATADTNSPPSAAKKTGPPDLLIFVNGDRITGTLIRGDSHEIVFQPAMLDQVKIPWTKIEELKTARPFVVVSTAKPTQLGTLEATPSAITVFTEKHISVPLEQDKTVMIVDPETYQTSIATKPEVWQAWTGTVSAGINIVEATQSAHNYTGDLALTRTTPRLAWLSPKDRTTLVFHGNFGKLSQPGEPTVRTDIYHGMAEQDEFFSPRYYAFTSATYDHNIAQGLSLQQAYGSGIGAKLLRGDTTQLELKGDLHYTRQDFDSSELISQPFLASTDNLLGSTFSVVGVRKFSNKLIWTANANASPAYNAAQAFQASGASTWTMPVYRTLSLNVGLIESYLNNPQPGFRRNSLQFTSGFQFAFR